MKVEHITHMGDDLMVVNAARCSFNKWKTEFDNRDKGLIEYLADHKHWSPFSHPQIQVRITAPVCIAAQLRKSVVGLHITDEPCPEEPAHNEVSRRYVDDEPTFYIPDKWRGRPEGSIKQGSSEETILHLEEDPNLTTEWTDCKILNKVDRIPINWEYIKFIEDATALYNRMLKSDVAPEMARMILPQSMNTSWIWTGSLLAFIRIYKQRIDKHSQLECQMIAQQIGEILKEYFPVSFEAWTGGGA